jgi:hypothetical protein
VVFATSQDKDVLKNISTLKNEVALLSKNNQFKIDALDKFIPGDNNQKRIEEFVASFT